MNAPVWPINPGFGQVFGGSYWNGRQWTKLQSDRWATVQTFTASGVYTAPPALLYVIVECIGPGGGGGWATIAVDGVTGYAVAAGGGGSGGYSRKTLPVEMVAGGIPVTIGAGGLVPAAQIGGGKTSGTTSFGAFCVANGGGDAQSADGSGVIPGAHGLPGAGGALGIGDIVLPGAAGGMWAAININILVQHLAGAVPGLGGQLFGGGVWPVPPWLYTNVNGQNGAPNSGAGGGGAQVNTGSTLITQFGGAGGSGYCIVTEFSGFDSDCGCCPPVERCP